MMKKFVIWTGILLALLRHKQENTYHSLLEYDLNPTFSYALEFFYNQISKKKKRLK
jgi:hypothetical protein